MFLFLSLFPLSLSLFFPPTPLSPLPPPVSLSLLFSLLSFSRIQVAHILAAIQAGAVGTQACNEAVDSINGVVSDLETAAMFATAGALTSDGPKGTFTEHCQSIVETAKV